MSSNESDQDDIVLEYENHDSEGEIIGNTEDNAPNNEDNESKEDKNDESDGKKVDPATKSRKTRSFVTLNTALLKGPKGVHTIEKYFEGFKFHGKNCEKEDLDRIMKRMEHWAHRLFPKLDFDDYLQRIEQLGCKKDMNVFVKKYRMDMLMPDDDIIRHDLDDDKDKGPEVVDDFDRLFAENNEIRKQLDQNRQVMEVSQINETLVRPILNDEIRARIERNRLAALEKKRARFAQIQQNTDNVTVASLQETAENLKERIERNRQQALERKVARLKKLEKNSENSQVEDSGEKENVENSQVQDSIEKEKKNVENSQVQDSAEKEKKNVENSQVQDSAEKEKENVEDSQVQDSAEKEKENVEDLLIQNSAEKEKENGDVEMMEIF